MKIDFEMPQALAGLMKPARYKVTYGGRGGGKSFTIASWLDIYGVKRPIRVLCAREYQVSIRDSVHRLLADRIAALGLSQFYTVTQTSIIGTNGTEFIFKGLHHNAQEIKSMEGVDICWVEEASSVSAESWDVLIPTIRKPGSEIWLSFNPLSPDDATWTRFVKNPPPGAWVQKVLYSDNPWFPAVLDEERRHLQEIDPELYQHIWLGEPRTISDAQVFKGRYLVQEFETPKDARFFHGCDWGFACLVGDTVIITETGNKLLKDVKTGDKVLTRDGYKTVIHAQSRGVKSVYGIDCGYKRRIIATEDHRLFTADGWRQVKDLKETETLCMMKSNLMARFIKGILTASTRIISTGSSAENVNMKACTAQSGNFIMVKSQKVATFITSMVTRLIMILRTYSALLKANIKRFIIRISSAKSRVNDFFNTDTQKKTGQNEERNRSQQHKNGMVFVWSAASRLFSQMFIKNIVRRNVESTKTCETAKKNTLANGAVRFLQRLLILIEKPVLKNVRINLQSLGEAEVFDITVENGEYFANGVLVHNCDPTALVRCFIRGNVLYIDREAYGVGIELDETPQLFDSIETARKWPIYADSARPETISFMKRRGFHIMPAKKWAGSVEDGIAVLKSFDKIIVHPRCVHTADEFYRYSYKVDKNNGDVLPVIVDAYNHCVAEGTIITTERGSVPIEKVTTSDKVLTREGFKRVLWSGKTGENREVLEISAGGFRLICTPEHLIYTVNRGFVKAATVTGEDVLLCLEKQLYTTDLLGTDIQTRDAEATACITSAQLKKTANITRKLYTGTFTKKRMAKSRRASTSITKTGTLTTTRLKIWNVFPPLNMRINTHIPLNGWKSKKFILTALDRSQRHGIKARKAAQNTKKSAGLRIRISRQNRSNARIAARRFFRENSAIKTDSVQMLVNQLGGDNSISTMKKGLAQFAASPFLSINTTRKKLVPVRVQTVSALKKPATVYDLAITGQNEFFANNILIHNCLDAARYSLSGYITRGSGMKINPLNLRGR